MAVNEHDHRLRKGNVIKLGRLKFRVKDLRTETEPANYDLHKLGQATKSLSPLKKRFREGGEKED